MFYLYKSNTKISFNDVIASDFKPLVAADIVNPNNEKVACNLSNKIISIYRDSDLVYYYNFVEEFLHY